MIPSTKLAPQLRFRDLVHQLKMDVDFDKEEIKQIRKKVPQAN